MQRRQAVALVVIIGLLATVSASAGVIFTFPSDDPALPITFQGGPSTISSSFDVPLDALIEDINVSVDFTDGFFSEIEASITSPSGTTVSLWKTETVTNANMDVLFDDEAVAPLPTTTFTPVSGTFLPLGSLSDFDGENVSGSWTLSVTDNEDFFVTDSRDANTLFGWSLEVTVPEPSVLSLVAIGGLLVVFRRRRSR